MHARASRLTTLEASCLAPLIIVIIIIIIKRSPLNSTIFIVGIFRDDEENIGGSFVCVLAWLLFRVFPVFCILSSFDDRMQVRNTKKQTKMALIIPKSEKILI